MDLFDIIGPVMVGPSSSHTAGAARIGKITRMLLGSRPVSARIGLYGSFQKTYLGHGTDKALIGGLLGMNVDDSRLRDSLRLAAEAKLEYSFYNADVRGAHPNTVILDVDGDDGRHIQVQASSVGGLVEVPCVYRNVGGVSQAVSAAQLALSGVACPIPLDEMILTMRDVGDAMPSSLRETGEGGCAACHACRRN